MRLINLSLLLAVITTLKSYSQSAPANAYGLVVVSQMDDYRAGVEADPSQELVSLEKLIPGLRLDIRYATVNNFMKVPMYDRPAAFLRRPAALALQKVQAELGKQGLGLKIYDAYRPYTVTVAFYEKVRDSVYVASPKRGSRHNRGCAVDLTVVDLRTGMELQMPTGFDDFTVRAHTQFGDLPAAIIRNRELLKSAMLKQGFVAYPDEWWHFDFKDWNRYPLMDISFEQLNEQ